MEEILAVIMSLYVDPLYELKKKKKLSAQFFCKCPDDNYFRI